MTGESLQPNQGESKQNDGEVEYYGHTEAMARDVMNRHLDFLYRVRPRDYTISPIVDIQVEKIFLYGGTKYFTWAIVITLSAGVQSYYPPTIEDIPVYKFIEGSSRRFREQP